MKDSQTKILNSKTENTLSYLKLVWKYRATIHNIGKQQLKSKFATTYLGLIISLVKLVISLLIYYLVFGLIIKINIANTHYLVFVLLGLSVWNLFNTILSESSAALLSTKNLFTKTYIPKMCLPISKIYIGVFDFLVSFIVLVLLLIFFKVHVDFRVLLVPVLFLLNIFAGLTMGMWISIFSIKKRDLLHLVPYLISFGFFITPVFYPTTIIPQEYAFIAYVNPLAYIIDMYRWIFTGQAFPSLLYLYGFIPMIVLFVWSFILYRKKDKILVDFI